MIWQAELQLEHHPLQISLLPFSVAPPANTISLLSRKSLIMQAARQHTMLPFLKIL
jgi:hypothetical protein